MNYNYANWLNVANFFKRGFKTVCLKQRKNWIGVLGGSMLEF